MPPRPAKSMLPDHLAKGLYWLIQPMLEARWSGARDFQAVDLAAESSDIFALWYSDRRIKQLAGSTTFDTLAAKLIDAFRHAGDPKPDHNPHLFEYLTLTTEVEHQWRKAQVIQALLEPVMRLRSEEHQESQLTKNDPTVRRYHPHVECYRRHMEPLLEHFGGGELLSPDLLFDHPHLETYYQATGAAFNDLQKTKNETSFQKKLEAHRRRIYNTKRSTKQYVDALIEAHQGLCVTYLALAHTHDYDRAPRERHAPFTKSKKDFSKFFQKVANRAYPDQQAGYLWKLQRSLRRGYHHHCFFFFKPEESQHWQAIRDHLCGLWIDDITAGKGIIYQHNYRQVKYNSELLLPEQPSIHHQGDDTYRRLFTMLDPLIHIDDVTYLELPKGSRSFGRGQLPKPQSP